MFLPAFIYIAIKIHPVYILKLFNRSASSMLGSSSHGLTRGGGTKSKAIASVFLGIILLTSTVLMVAPPTQAFAAAITTLDISSHVTNPTLITNDGQLFYVYDHADASVSAFDTDGTEDNSKDFDTVDSPNVGADTRFYIKMTYDNGYFLFVQTAPGHDDGNIVAFRANGDEVFGDDIPSKYTVDYVTSKQSSGIVTSFGGHDYTLDEVAKTVSVTVTPASVPAAPTGLVAPSSPAGVMLQWDAPGNTGGSPITGYVIEYAVDDGTSPWVTRATDTADTTAAFGDLLNGRDYVFRVKAANSVGTGPVSDTVTATIPASAPYRVENLVAEAGNVQGSVALSWDAPVHDGGKAISDYVIKYSSGSGSTWDIFSDGVKTDTSAVIPDLDIGVSYSFKVTAENSIGEGPPSDVVTFAPQETTDPTVTLLGPNPYYIQVNNDYVEHGVEAADNLDDNPKVQTVLRGLDTASAGSYFVTYVVTDSAGNTASVTRDVHVYEPVIYESTESAGAHGYGSQGDRPSEHIISSVRYGTNPASEQASAGVFTLPPKYEFVTVTATGRVADHNEDVDGASPADDIRSVRAYQFVNSDADLVHVGTFDIDEIFGSFEVPLKGDGRGLDAGTHKFRIYAWVTTNPEGYAGAYYDFTITINNDNAAADSVTDADSAPVDGDEPADTTAPAGELVLRAPDSGGYLLTDRYVVAHVDDTDSIGDIAVRGTGPTSADAARLTVHDENKAYMRDVALDSGGWHVTIPAASLSPGDNKFFLRNTAASDGTKSWASFHIIIVERPQDAVQSAAVSVSPSDGAAVIKSKVESAPSGAVVTFEDGTYDSIGTVKITKPLTLKSSTGDQSDSDARFTRNITFDIRSDDVRVAGLKFVGVTSEAPVKVSYVTASDVVIEKNLFDGMSKYGVYRYNNPNGDTFSLDKGTYAERMTVDQNVFRDIGFQGMSSAERTAVTDDKTIPAGSKVGIAIKVDGVRDSVISGNNIDKSTGSGILLNFAEDVTVKGNTISNVIADGIKVDRSASGIVIYDNQITKSAYADRFTDDDTTAKPIDSAHAAIAILKADDATVRDNVIGDSKTGILFCKGTCDENYEPIPESDSRSYSEGPSTGHVTRNILKDIGMQYIVNAQPDERLPAQLNYFDVADPGAKITGKVYYGPWYADEGLTTLSTTGAAQTSNARAFSSSTCSISLEHSPMTFSNTIYGQNSDPQTQNVSNTGSSDLTGIMLESTGWKKADGTVLPTVHTDVRDTASNTYQKLSSTDTASFDTTLGASSADRLSLEFVMDLRDATTGPAEELTETVVYLASCS